MAIVNRIERTAENRDALFPRVRQRLFLFLILRRTSLGGSAFLRLRAAFAVVIAEATAWRTIETIAVAVTIKTTARTVESVAIAVAVETAARTVESIAVPSAETILARPRISRGFFLIFSNLRIAVIFSGHCGDFRRLLRRRTLQSVALLRRLIFR